MKYILILIMSIFIFTSCTGQKIVSAPDKPVILATSDMKCVKTAERRDWYFFWGLASFEKKENLTASLLTDVNKPVKVEVTTTFTDAMLTILTGLASFVPQTTIVYECDKK
jgi:hypothetical protein